MQNQIETTPLAKFEEARLAAVRRYDVLDTPPDGAFDRITALAAQLFDVPISIISIVDHDRIWFKSHHGLQVDQIDREPGLCASAILQQGPWHLSDARVDARALTNPLVAGEFGLRFYAGIPLRTMDGFNLGTLCVIAAEPREVTELQIHQLRQLAALVMDQLELRRSARSSVRELRDAMDTMRLLSKEIDHRVMNSLQIVASLLALQSRATSSTQAADQLKLAANRVMTVAQVHRHFYYVYFPTEGFVSLLAPFKGESALEVGMVGHEGMLGVQIVLGVASVPLTGVVQGAGTALRIDAPAFRLQLARSAALKRTLDRYVHVLMSQMVTSAACLRFHLLAPRLARWLLMSQDRAQSDSFPVTHQFLSSMSGVRRVGVTSAAGTLQRAGLIEYRRGALTVLDRAGLKAASCDCYANDRHAYSAVLQ